jgi:hypothetical protein
LPSQISSHSSKQQIFRQYKFCIAMERAAAKDYFSETLFEAFRAG